MFTPVGVKCCDSFLLCYLTPLCFVVPSPACECECCTRPSAAMAGHHLAIGCNTMVDGHMPSHMGYAPFSCRSPSEAPLRKLTVDLIKTYRKINEVQTVVCLFVCIFCCCCCCLFIVFVCLLGSLVHLAKEFSLVSWGEDDRDSIW